MKRAALLAATIAIALPATAPASSSRIDRLKASERRHVRVVEQSKTILRFFERHPRILYSHNPKVKRRAWHVVAVARQRIIFGRRHLAWTRKEIARLTPPLIPHLAAWLCIHGHEAGWDGTDNKTHDTYFGGLQMDRAFMRSYGAAMLRKYGGRYANHWTPTDQMLVAERAYLTRGFWPWPNTARKCGLL